MDCELENEILHLKSRLQPILNDVEKLRPAIDYSDDYNDVKNDLQKMTDLWNKVEEKDQKLKTKFHGLKILLKKIGSTIQDNFDTLPNVLIADLEFDHVLQLYNHINYYRGLVLSKEEVLGDYLMDLDNIEAEVGEFVGNHFEKETNEFWRRDILIREKIRDFEGRLIVLKMLMC
jgi:uncharacterized protein (DUF608 family)